MIGEAVRVLFLGMLGVFVVMGVIIGAITLLGSFGKKRQGND